MDRRTVIADAAIELIAGAGLRALTHRGVDSALELPAGSTSYYFRKKTDLLTAVIERIRDSSRSAFEDAPVHPKDSPADVTVRYLEHLLVQRPDQLRARHALLIDPSIDSGDRAMLARSLFSVDRAADLLGDRSRARGFVALCEGLVILALVQGWTEDSLRDPIVTYLTGAQLVRP